jgi:type I thyroxine 5'-deiodinase
VEIFCVYIQEAHPDDGWQLLMNLDQQIVFDQPEKESERAAIAHTCAIRLELEMPVLLDTMSNEVDVAYSALPERLYAIDREGVITWRSEPGPWGFDVDQWEREIAALAKA